MNPWREGMALDPAVCYCNHAGVSPLPRRSAQRLVELAQWLARGPMHYGELERHHEETRALCGRLSGAAADQVALIPNTATGLSWVALGVDWRPGDEIVTTDQEFPSNLVPWLMEARRQGVTVHQVPSLSDGGVSAAALLARVTPRTRLVTVSWVQYRTGAVVDLAHLGRELRSTDTLLVVDGIQGAGALPCDPLGWGVDVFAAGGHKWLMGVEGCGFMVLSCKAMATLTPRVVGWNSVANAGRYDEPPSLNFRPGASRFEPSSRNHLGAAVLGESVAWLLEAGMEEVGRRVRGLTRELHRGLTGLGCRCHTPLLGDGGPGAGILVFSHPERTTAELHAALSRARIYHVPRGPGIRLSPHFYQDEREVEGVLGTVAALLGR